jgi:CubicO group peptidase (beta-lactamase class C family)
MRMKRAGLLLLCATAVLAQDPSARIDAIFQAWDKPATPGASVAVIQHGKLVYQKGYGIANLEYDVPIKPETIFHVASVSKQFTAMSIVLLENDGKLSIDDDVHKYLTELPDYGRKITLRNLMQHTSGIRDQWQTLGIAGWRLDDVITQQQILGVLFRQKELNFEPGTRHLYSNGGYSLLAEVVGRVSGKPLPEFCDERIYRPLGMTRTHFHDDHRRLVPGRAYSYARDGSGFQASPLNYANVGATSLFTTAPDLARWLDNFRDPKVGGAKAIARLQEQAVLSDGTKIDYALGVVVDKYRGLRTISHSGGDAGYRSHVLWFPDQELGVVVLSNFGAMNPGYLANRVAAVYLAKEMSPEPAPPKPAPPGQSKAVSAVTEGMEQYTGAYWSDEVETLYTVRLKDGKLFAEHVHHGEIGLTPAGQDAFRSSTWFMPEVKFLRDGSGKVTAMTLGGNRLSGIRFTKRQ